MYYPVYIFDLYGTLADIRTDENGPALWRRTALWYREHGADWEGPGLRARYGELCRREQERFPDPLAEIELRKVFEALFEEKGVRPDRVLTEETARFFRICSLKKLKRYPWVEPVFGRLSANGSRLFLLSNAQACFTEGELEALGLSGAFEGIVLSSDAGVRKPSQKILRMLLDRYGLDPQDCLMVGNDPDTDIAMAAASGMDSLYLRTATSPRDRVPEQASRMLLDGDHSRLEVLLRRS